jgi:hypothetical protein
MTGALTDRRLALVSVFASGAFLVGMVAIGLATGATQEFHEHFKLPNVYKRDLLEHADALRVVFALDVGFVVAYTVFFAALARYLRARGRPYVYLALGAMLAVSVLDLVEDHHILALLDAAEHGVVPNVEQIAWQVAESSVKFSTSYVALVLFGIAIPRDTRLGIALALFLTVGTLATGVFGYAAPPSLRASLDSGRWLGFLVGFALAAGWLWKAPEPEAPARPKSR